MKRGERIRAAVAFINGLPLTVIALKNPADQNADVWKACRQLQTYKAEP